MSRASLCLLLATLGCSSTPEDLRPWRPTDHTNAAAVQGPNAARQVSGEAKSSVAGLDEVTIAAWRANCASCHGSLGRGDGPQGPMYKPRDLSEPAWQRSVTDEQIVQVIRTGKGKMPGFALPDKVVRNLASLVRLMDRERINQSASGGEPPAAGHGVSGVAATQKGAASPAPSGAPHSGAPNSSAPHAGAPAPSARQTTAPLASGKAPVDGKLPPASSAPPAAIPATPQPPGPVQP